MLQNLSLFFCHLVYHLDSAALRCISLRNSIYWYTNAPKSFPLLRPPRISSLLNLCCCWCWLLLLLSFVGIFFFDWNHILFLVISFFFDCKTSFFLMRLPFWKVGDLFFDEYWVWELHSEGKNVKQVSGNSFYLGRGVGETVKPPDV